MYLSAIGLNAKTQAAVFLHVVGDDALEVYNNFTFADGDEMKLHKIMENFEAYCIPKRNVTFERHTFFTCHIGSRI